MYESPVNIIYGEMQTQIEGDVFKAIQNVGIDVNKEELIKALQYDREQYSKGYKDGYAKAIDDFLEEMEKWNSQIKFMRNENAFFTIENIREVAEQLKGEKQ